MKEKEKTIQLMVAPLQGLTEAAWRSVHQKMFGSRQGQVEYFTPFIRVEKGKVRDRDLRDFTSELNDGLMLTPQIIFRDEEEWKILVETLAEAGAERIDMNLGCPFPPQVKKGRGAGIIARPDALEKIANSMLSYSSDIRFSVKMRLGVNDSGEALKVTEILNAMPLRHLTVHPRTARQQYKGELLIEEMKELTCRLKHPVIFNGEISTPADIEALSSEYAGVMAGRGLLARPSIFAEFLSGREMTPEDQMESFLALVRGTYDILSQRLCGKAQIRDKMKPYWEYAPSALDRKIAKQYNKTQ